MKQALGGQKPRNQSVDLEKSVIAPIRGLNSRDPLGAMHPEDALVLDNFICRPSSIEVRKGMANFVTGFALDEEVWSLMAYKAAPTDKLFAGTDLGIYNVTTAGVVGAAVAASTNGRWEYINGSNAGIRYLLAVNGSDPMKFYNGSVWADTVVTGISSTAKFTNIAQFKFRVYFTEKDTLSFWYLAVNAVQGLATEFPLAPLFIKGGSLLAIGNWTLDGGNGPDDYCAFLTTEGELAVYKGTDPSSAANWSLVGVYALSRPIGRKCMFKFGGDLVIITESGLVKMTSVLSAVEDRTASISDKIIGALSESARLYKNNFGWSLTHLSAEDIIILNVPVVEGSVSQQFVMNTLTGAWSMFRQMNACCFVEMGARLYFGTTGKVVNAMYGQSDFGNNITLKAQTSYSNFGMPMKNKHIKLLRLNYRTSKDIAVRLAISVNYQETYNSSSNTLVGSDPSIYDTSLWDTAVWEEPDHVVNSWRSVANKSGYMQSLLVTVSDVNYTFEWNSTDFLIEHGSAF
jgi:hypothetical protein